MSLIERNWSGDLSRRPKKRNAKAGAYLFFAVSPCFPFHPVVSVSTGLVRRILWRSRASSSGEIDFTQESRGRSGALRIIKEIDSKLQSPLQTVALNTSQAQKRRQIGFTVGRWSNCSSALTTLARLSHSPPPLHFSRKLQLTELARPFHLPGHSSFFVLIVTVSEASRLITFATLVPSSLLPWRSNYAIKRKLIHRRHANA